PLRSDVVVAAIEECEAQGRKLCGDCRSGSNSGSRLDPICRRCLAGRWSRILTAADKEEHEQAACEARAWPKRHHRWLIASGVHSRAPITGSSMALDACGVCQMRCVAFTKSSGLAYMMLDTKVCGLRS